MCGNDIGRLDPLLGPAGRLWVAYPKGKAVKTDLNRDTLRAFLGDRKWKAVSLVAIDDLWAAMRFKPQGAADRKVDVLGIATLIACITPLLLALTWATDLGWEAPRVRILIGTAVVMLFAFLAVERRASEPLIPLSLFSNPIVAI